MKVLYLTFDDLTIPFAWSVHVREVVNGLVDRGHEVRLVCPAGRAPGVRADCDPLPPGKLHHWSGSLSTFVRSGRAIALARADSRKNFPRLLARIESLAKAAKAQAH